MTSTVQAIIILGSLFGGLLIGPMIGRALRMPDHGWRLGVILASIALGTSLVCLRPIKQGIDLRGGVILIYEVDEDKTRSAAVSQSGGEDIEEEDTRVDMGDLIQALQKRINPSGVREVVIRPYGDKQVEIIIPDVSDSEIEIIKKSIVSSGFLKFRIVANQTRNEYEWELAENALNSPDATVRTDKFVRNEDGEVIGEWVMIGREDKEVADGELAPLRFEPEQVASMLTRELLPGEIEAFVLIDPDPNFNVEGKHLRSVSADFDETAQPCINFQMNSEGSVLFGQLTSSNLPNDAGVRAPLAIIMDDLMLSAPGIKSTITSNGVIEGNFEQTEVDYMVRVLRAGKLPAVLQEEPISDSKISPLLGEDTIRKGKWAIGTSLIAVLVFMLLYYRFAGFVACLALVVNIVLIVAAMILIKGAFTLPGLAGLVLTVGMSVDANVLIFERIREELKRGSALRMAIRNGYGRATSTVVDANLTTLIAAIVLYVVGTETIKGFAITLILGILVSLYTAIFCSRVIFDIAERKKWITRLNMTQALGDTNINFLGKRRIAATISLLAIALGLSAVFVRNKDILDIDFTGGTSVQVMLQEPLPIGELRSNLEAADIPDFAVAEVKPEGQADNTVYKIDSSIDREEELQTKIKQLFTDPDGNSQLQSHKMEFSAPSGLSQFLPRRSWDGTLLAYAGRPQRIIAQSEETTEALADVTPVDNATDQTTDQEDSETTDTSTSDSPATDSPANDSPANDSPANDSSSTTATTPAESDDASEVTDVKQAPLGLEFLCQSNLEFDEKIGASTLKTMIEGAAEELGMTAPRTSPANPDWNGKSDRGFSNWTVKFTSNPTDSAKILDRVQAKLSESPVWLSSSKIGSKVAGDMQTAAMMAIFVSLVGIVGYIWLRFQRVGFGLAAVLALVHDVAITLGAVAISYWLAKPLGFLMIDEFKISLPIVAAFLTIIGYSLNDTIVVFDRIREVKGKSPVLTEEMVNRSINQTLSRTLLTSITTLIVVAILYVFGGQGIHGFAFALLIGVLVGTYSSIFVASPALLWMTTAANKKKVANKKNRETAAIS